MANTGFIGRLERLQNRFLDWARSKRADEVATTEPTGRIEDLRGRNYCVLVTYRKNGAAIPSPLWFGIGNAKIYVHTGGVKLKRIERNPNVLVAPCTFRGRPLGPPIKATARLLSSGKENDAEASIQSNYGFQRRIYNRMLGDLDAVGTYIEITPMAGH